uniref:Uncharacterized protein n=2 Tax=Physcomitrium patens TaxID=3218 RepID=A0A7I3Z6H2_PHYPA
MKVKICHQFRATASGIGDVAQMVERSLSMREVWGSIPHFSSTWLARCVTTTFVLSLM